jgi:hypothetical protein
VAAAPLPVAAQQPDLVLVQIDGFGMPEPLQILKFVRARFGQLLGKVGEDCALVSLALDELSDQSFIDVGQPALDRLSRIDKRKEREQVLDDRRARRAARVGVLALGLPPLHVLRACLPDR